MFPLDLFCARAPFRKSRVFIRYKLNISTSFAGTPRMRHGSKTQPRHLNNYNIRCQKFVVLKHTVYVQVTRRRAQKRAWAGALLYVVSGSFSMRNVGTKSVLIYRDCCRSLCTQFASLSSPKVSEAFCVLVYFRYILFGTEKVIQLKNQTTKLSSARFWR